MNAKIIRKTTLLLLGSLFTLNCISQTKTSYKNYRSPETQEVRSEDILWEKYVYRQIDLNKEQNAALYYPVESSGDEMNLFTTIFNAIAHGNVTAYEYLDGKEISTPDYEINFSDLLKRFEIPYKEKKQRARRGEKAKSTYEIDPLNIPSSEVTLYYIKEIYYLTQRNSEIKKKIIAICPVLNRTDEMGEKRKLPMFWVKISDVKPMLSTQTIAINKLNSAENYTLYDFFNSRKYYGEIYKVSNLKNQNIWDYCKTEKEIKKEQKRLEKKLSTLDSLLWEKREKK